MSTTNESNEQWTPESFTKHVGAPSFTEAVDVLLRTKQQDEEKIEQMYNRIKAMGKTIDDLNEAAIERGDVC